MLGVAPRSCWSCGDPTHRVGEDACFYKETALQPQSCSACHMGGHLRQHCCGPNQRAIQALRDEARVKTTAARGGAQPQPRGGRGAAARGAGKKPKNTLNDKFLIQSYTKAAAEVTANCSFCNLRINLPKQRRPEGITFELKIPFTIWAMDYVILDSRWEKPAALTLVDPFSGYIIFISCTDKMSDVELIKLLYK